MDSKVWWLSKTIVFNLVALIAAILQGSGVIDIGVGTQETIALGVINVANIILRFRTTAPVTVSRGTTDVPL